MTLAIMSVLPQATASRSITADAACSMDLWSTLPSPLGPLTYGSNVRFDFQACSLNRLHSNAVTSPSFAAFGDETAPRVNITAPITADLMSQIIGRTGPGVKHG